MPISNRVFCVSCLLIVSLLPCYAQLDSLQEPKKKALRVFIDCSDCDDDFIRSEITFVNYVRDRKEAQVHILVSTQQTGSGGTEHALTFIGQQDFAGNDDTLKYISNKTDTDEMIRVGIVRAMKLGLVRYVARTPLADQITISYKLGSEPRNVEEEWDYWVFSISLNSYLNGQQTNNSKYLYGTLSASRVTPDLKINLSASANYNDSFFQIDDTTTVSSFSRGQSFNGMVAFSLSDHWSTGASTSVYTSTYSNIEISAAAGPAIEYDLFPYSESTRRQLRFWYKIPFEVRNYYEETIYDKNSERLLSEDLSVNLSVKEPWGTVSTTLDGSHYFHDVTKYHLEIYGTISLRLFEGLSLNLYGDASKIHDQLSLPQGSATEDEILLYRRQLETQYQYYASVGLSYTFGSIFNNVVNPRFGSNY